MRVANDVLGNHHGIVDDEPDRDRHRAERHQVERLPDPRHHKHRDGHRQRDGRRADRSDPTMAQEQQKNDHRQHGADDHRVAHRLHGVAHQRCLVVHGLEVDSRRKLAAQTLCDGGDAVGYRHRVAADLPRDIE